jgi:hypothetical protein
MQSSNRRAIRRLPAPVLIRATEKEIREIPSGLQLSQTGYEKFPDFPFMGLNATLRE